MSRRGLDLGPSFAPELVKKYESAPLPDRPILEAHQLVSRTQVQKQDAPPPAAPKPKQKINQKMEFVPSFGSLVSRSDLAAPRPILNKQIDQVAWEGSTDNPPDASDDLAARLRKQRLSSPWQVAPMDANAIAAALLNGK